MNQPSRLHLFQAFGIELEYMLVDKDTLTIKPITDELLKHELGASDEDICQRLRTDVAVMYACGLPAVQADQTQAHFVLPETLAQFRQRIDQDLLDELVAIQAAAAMAAGLVSPAHLLVDTFPAEQGSQRVTDATTLYKAPKNSCTSLNRSARSARSRPRA